jgi:hypothetical protein
MHEACTHTGDVNPQTMSVRLFMAKFHVRYCGLVRGPHVENNSKWYTLLPKLL